MVSFDSSIVECIYQLKLKDFTSNYRSEPALM